MQEVIEEEGMRVKRTKKQALKLCKEMWEIIAEEDCNKEKAEIARTLIRESIGYRDTDLETNVCDLLADLMHLTEINKWNWEAMLGRASIHFNAELLDEED